MEEKDYLCTQISTNEPFMDFKETFKRYNTNISQMAQAMGIAQQSLSRKITTGSVDIRDLHKMAEICGVSLAEFVGAEPPAEIRMTFNGKEYTYQLKE